MNIKPKGVFIAGIGISFIAMVIRLNARSIAWPKSASWGAQVEATPFYATLLAIADVSDLFLAFGLLLVAAVVIRELFIQREKAEQSAFTEPGGGASGSDGAPLPHGR